MAWSDMRAVTVSGATLAFVGCCLFVMHTENASFQGESVWETKLPRALAKAAKEAGDDAEGPKVTPSKVIGGNVNAVVAESKPVKPQMGAGKVNWSEAHGVLETNCLALKGFAYVAKDQILDSSFKQLGVTYQLLQALSPDDKPTQANASPKECIKQYNAFIAAVKEDYPLKGSLPEKELEAIEVSMNADGGLLTTVKHGEKKVITLDGEKIGLANTDAIDNLGVEAEQSEVFAELNKMSKGDVSIATSIKTQEHGMNKKTAQGLEHWDGKELQ